MEEDLGSSVNQDFPQGMAPKMLNLLKVVDGLEKDLAPLISRPYHEVFSKLSPLDRAKIGMMEIYTINALFWVLMRTSGEDTAATLREDCKVEMARLKETQARISEIEARAHRQRLNTEAAARFISRGLGYHIGNTQMEESGSSAYMDNNENTMEEQGDQESSSSSESEDEESDGETQMLQQGDSQNRLWYGEGW